MKNQDGIMYSESIQEHYALVGDEDHKEGARQVLDSGIDLIARYGLSDGEYNLLNNFSHPMYGLK